MSLCRVLLYDMEASVSLCRVLLIRGSVSVFVSCLIDAWKCQCLVSWR